MRSSSPTSGFAPASSKSPQLRPVPFGTTGPPGSGRSVPRPTIWACPAPAVPGPDFARAAGVAGAGASTLRGGVRAAAAAVTGAGMTVIRILRSARRGLVVPLDVRPRMPVRHALCRGRRHRADDRPPDSNRRQASRCIRYHLHLLLGRACVTWGPRAQTIVPNCPGWPGIAR